MQSRLSPVIAVYALESVCVLTASYLLLPVVGLNGIAVAWVSTQVGTALIVISLLVKRERWSIAKIK